jgi:predicted DNA-binding mobile mystery protein A
MQAAAEAMNCRFVYAIVPASGSIETLLEQRARKKAEELVKRAGQHMALENQALSQDSYKQEIERLARQLVEEAPTDFWEDG